MVLNRKLDGFVAVTGTITVVVNPHSVLLLSGLWNFSGQRLDYMKKLQKVVCNSPPLWIEERKYIVWLQKLM